MLENNINHTILHLENNMNHIFLLLSGDLIFYSNRSSEVEV